MNQLLKLKKFFFNLIILPIIIIFCLSSCGGFNKSDARKVSPNADERVKQNIEQGRGIRLGDVGAKGRGGAEGGGGAEEEEDKEGGGAKEGGGMDGA